LSDTGIGDYGYGSEDTYYYYDYEEFDYCKGGRNGRM
jgi:hypothetical protein